MGSSVSELLSLMLLIPDSGFPNSPCYYENQYLGQDAEVGTGRNVARAPAIVEGGLAVTTRGDPDLRYVLRPLPSPGPVAPGCCRLCWQARREELLRSTLRTSDGPT